MEVGSIGKGKLEVKYGKPFPKVGDERTIYNHMGQFIIRYTWIGTPEWTSKYTVLVPTRFELVEVVELSKKQKVKESGFRIIKTEN